MMAFLPDLSVVTSVYRGEKYLPDFFANLRAQTIFPRCELVLVLNEATRAEKQLAKDFAAKASGQVQVIEVAKVESLGASWNRGWQAARAPYLAIWNIDDRRRPDSLDRQLAVIEEKPEWQLCYGDYITVSEYGSEKGILRSTPPYSAGYFRRAFAQGGAFWLLRKSLGARLAYFDEQFQVGPDMEMSFRIAAAGLRMVRCDGVLGYFTDAAQGLSTRDGAQRSAVERTAIQLRYGVFDKVRRQYEAAAREYNLDSIQNSGGWLPLTQLLPDHANYLQRRRPLLALAKLRNSLRSLLERTGLLKLLYKLQEKFLKREI
jgi:glycosyltransferase involved in cell wall biosynthesis